MRKTELNNTITLGATARDIIDDVMKVVKEAVVSTMGPNGSLAMIESGVSTKTTKDGVTVARSIKFQDGVQELVNRVITEPAIKTDKECGDGTTTTILLTAVLYEIFKAFPKFHEQRVIEELVQKIIVKLSEMAIRVDVNDPRLYQMALTSSNQDVELATMVTNLYKDAKGRFPEIELKQGMTLEDKIETIDGRVLKMYYSSPTFGSGGSGGERTLKQFFPVVIDNRLANLGKEKIGQVLSKVVNPAGPVLLIARNIEQDVITDIIGWIKSSLTAEPAKWLNHEYIKEGVFPVIALNTNMGGSVGTLEMQDLAVMLGGQMLNSFDDLEHLTLETRANTVTLGSSRSFLTDLDEPDEQRIEAHAQSIEKLLESYSMSERYSLRGKLQERRIRNLRGSLVTIQVGGETNSEIKERIDRYEDVVKAVRSGLENGILPGAGTSLMRAAAVVLDEFREDEKVQQGIKIKGVSPSEQIIRALYEMAVAQYIVLFDGVMDVRCLHQGEFGRIDLNPLLNPWVLDLSRGLPGAPEELGVYDTAFASITALKGGLQTAKLLANTKTLLLGGKLSAVNVPG